MNTTRILIADGHYLVRQGIRAVLQNRPGLDVVGEASNSDELRTQLLSTAVDVVVLDYESEAFALTDVRQVSREFNARVLIISADSNRFQIYKVLEYGAHSFLTKECDDNEILRAVYATASGEKFFCNKVLDLLVERAEQAEDPDCEPTVLTVREAEIVGLVAEGLKTAEIADQLCLSVHTVNTHRKNILRKLRLKSTAELVRYAINMSLVEIRQRETT